MTKEKYINKIVSRVSGLAAAKKLILVGVDGLGGAGKTTFCTELQERINGVQLVSLDEFYRVSSERERVKSKGLPSEEELDYPKLINEVLEPILKGQAANFTGYNWQTDVYDHKRKVEPQGVVIIEGVFALCKQLRKYYDYKIWVDAPGEVREHRVLEREGAEFYKNWEKSTSASYALYEKQHNPRLAADIIVS